MKTCFTLALSALLAGTVAGLPATAAAADTLPYGTFEVAPFIGYQLGGNFKDLDTGQHYSLNDHAVFALALDAPADLSSQYELFYSRQPTVLKGAGFAPVDVVVEYLHIGGTIPLDDSTRARPYLAGGLGVTRFSPDDPAARQDTVFSMSLALGLRMPITPHLSRAPGGARPAVVHGQQQRGVLPLRRRRGGLPPDRPGLRPVSVRSARRSGLPLLNAVPRH